jgi:hypothetical protein
MRPAIASQLQTWWLHMTKFLVVKVLFRIGFLLSQVHQELCKDSHTFDKLFEEVIWDL